MDAQALQALLVAEGITHVTLPPSLLKLMDLTEDYAFEALIVAGESIEQQCADSWAEHYPLFNAYGPSETTVCASIGRLRKGQPLHIGQPLNNFALYVLDERRQLLPKGGGG